jgi:hypothetical protein
MSREHEPPAEAESDAPSGVRYEFLIDAARSSDDRAVYLGTVRIAGAELGIEVVVTRAATEGRLLAPSAVESSAELVSKAAALVRAAARGPLLEGHRPPRRVHRWRP